MEKPSLEEKNLTQKPYLLKKRHLAIIVSGRVLDARYQGLFESGPKAST